MDAIRKTIVVLVAITLVFYLLLALLKLLEKLWWTPIRVQRMMRAQGIKGPSYKFIYGNCKEIWSMRKEAISKPMETSHSHHIFPRILPHIYSWMMIYGKNYLQWEGPQPVLVVTESEMIKEIMKNKDGDYLKPEQKFWIKSILGDGIATTTVAEKWGKLRRIANQAFHGDGLKGMIPAMVASTEMMLERWKEYEGKEMDAVKEFRLLTSEVISRTAFGSSYLEGEMIFNTLMRMMAIAGRNLYKLRISIISDILKSSDQTEGEKLEKQIRDAVIRMIRSRDEMVALGQADSSGDDLLGSLVRAHHDPDQSKRISFDDIVDECKSFYFAGQVTTNALLGWVAYLLAIHTNWQQEARKEVLEIFGENLPDADGISKLKTIGMIINETLRLYPPAIGFARTTKREVRLGGLTLPANMSFYIPGLALHSDPDIWGEDVHLFKPERFSEGNAKATNNNMTAFLPFGLGPRSCVGSNFATIEAKIALAMILKTYKFTLSPTYIHSPCQTIMVNAQHGVQLLLQAV